jgi:hypothetical protein
MSFNFSSNKGISVIWGFASSLCVDWRPFFTKSFPHRNLPTLQIENLAYAPPNDELAAELQV